MWKTRLLGFIVLLSTLVPTAKAAELEGSKSFSYRSIGTRERKSKVVTGIKRDVDEAAVSCELVPSYVADVEDELWVLDSDNVSAWFKVKS